MTAPKEQAKVVCVKCGGTKKVTVYKMYRAKSGHLEPTFDRYDPCPDCVGSGKE